MQVTTAAALGAILRADQSVTPAERNRLIALLKQGPIEAPAAHVERLVRRKEAAMRLGCGARTIDNLARAGTLQRVRLPGRVRGAGFRESDVDALVQGSTR